MYTQLIIIYECIQGLKKVSFHNGEENLFLHKNSIWAKKYGGYLQKIGEQNAQNQVRRNKEVYVDDMMFKKRIVECHVLNLEEVFPILRDFELHLNLMKCVFGMMSGNFLWYIVSSMGIEANLDKVATLINMRPPKCIQEVQ